MHALGRVEPRGDGAGAPQLLQLIGHERQQRRDDDGDAGQLERGELIGQRLAGARRHDGQHVLAGEEVADDLLLAGTEVTQVELAAQTADDRIELDLLAVRTELELAPAAATATATAAAPFAGQARLARL